ncbi:heterogeneous nuclear ribonucleo L isoform X2 [Brachionus plicatilis]|uniref:Heterogeneous nuclear ribonucleo L isoform X2 n=1 Tax=Brachionus plicatilis TaxID=10195 RepID=A0A3M7SUQ8_BRAPC|nr:heterogeneous nuclear ribonucleo L isoform X2 [Brachionus plicatilis]
MSNIAPPNKRMKTDSSSPSFSNAQKPSPSYVVHARNLSEYTTEGDLREALDRYGIIERIILMPRKRQALIQFEEITSSINLVNDSARNPITIANSTCFFNYSLNQKLVNKYETNEANSEDSSQGIVLCYTVHNALYPITVDVINTISSAFGQIYRIVITKKNGVQALVEFATRDSAERAKEELDNADIYSGCCTLKIDFSNIKTLKVGRNDQDQWDYTRDMDSQKTPLLQTPKDNRSSYNQRQTNPSHKSYQMNRSNGSNGQGDRNGYQSNKKDSLPSLMNNSRHNSDNQLILMINNLCTTKFNCDRLFNLLCLYGNVERIKFLITKEGSAMAMMNASDSILNFLQYINNVYIFGRKIHIHVSNQNELKPAIKPGELPDGTPSYKDFANCRNNRYSTNETASKNKPVAPANVLHWFNAPPGFTEQDVAQLFLNAGAKAPTKVKKSTTGLAEWNNIADCTEALILTNHTDIDHPSSKYPYTFKLCYSATPILDSTNGNSQSYNNLNTSNNSD